MQYRHRLEAARAEMEELLDAAPGTLIFTSGATESNNLALQGILLPKKLVTRGQLPLEILARHRWQIDGFSLRNQFSSDQMSR